VAEGKVKGHWRILRHPETHDLQSSPNIIVLIK
jgi:hypothetical protein